MAYKCMVIFYNVLPCVNYFDEGGVGDYKKECFHRFAVKTLLSFILSHQNQMLLLLYSL